MAKDNRIKLRRSWLITICLTAILLIAGVILAVILIQAQEEPKTPGSAVPEVTERADSSDLYCLEITRYSGPFVEDGTNEQVENVAAILVENQSDEFLERATVTYDVGGDVATFVVTGLPPGEKAWVLEAERMTLDAQHEFEFLDCTSSFRQDAVLSTELLTVTTEGNTVTVQNNSKEPLKNVCLYYKNMNSDGNYLGGISYMLTFDTLEGGESASKASAHYSDNSEIVRYSYQTE